MNDAFFAGVEKKRQNMGAFSVSQQEFRKPSHLEVVKSMASAELNGISVCESH